MAEDGLPLYHAIDKAAFYCLVPKFWVGGSVLSLAFISAAPGLSALYLSLASYVFWVLVEPSRMHTTRTHVTL